MNGCDRRHVLTSAISASALSVAAPWRQPCATAAGQARDRIKVGQIGIGHNHASAKMATFRKLADQYEVVGVVEPDAEWRQKRGNDPAYRDLTWLTAEPLLNTKDLAIVAVETDVGDLGPTAARCLDADRHLHLDKPGGESLAPFKKLLDEAGRRRLTVQLGCMYRNHPAVQFCQRAVREGWLGQIFEVHAVFPPMPGRYDDQLIELARIVRGEIANPYPLSHELMVQEALLGAIASPPLGQGAGER